MSLNLSVRADDLQSRINQLDMTCPERTSQFVELVLAEAVRQLATDVHFEPTHHSVEVRFRLDGVLQRAAVLPRGFAPNVVARLKVMAELLTYRMDVPQEGRVPRSANEQGIEMRVSTFPTIHGERAVVRIFDTNGQTIDLDQLGLPDATRSSIESMLAERSGAILLTGPSGSGKTTTIYACLRHIIESNRGGRHVVTIEDPVEQVIEGASQSQVRAGHEFDFARGLRSVLRQDPEVIMIGEVRDPETASIAIEAALTGHLVISTLHAGSACGVVGRLLEMGIEPYLLTSGLRGIVNQRLVRKCCDQCNGPRSVAPGAALAVRAKCPRCLGTGYHGRILLAEMLAIDGPLRQAILIRADTTALEVAAGSNHRRTLWDAAAAAISSGLTSPEEVERVLGRSR